MAPHEALDRLISCLGRLPGIGRKSAERMALKLVRDPSGLMRDLVAAIEDAGRNLCACSRCGNVTSTTENPCRLCTNPARDGAILCVVEDPSDIVSIERSGGFRGRYHSLGGKLSAAKGMGPDELRVRAFLARVKEENFEEVVLALSTDMEGDATAAFLADQLKKAGVKTSRLAFGLPAGSGIGYSDPVTLARAFKGRMIE